MSTQPSLARRRLLHKRVADALVGRNPRGRREADLASLIAQHYRMAGINARAAENFKTAGDRARILFANTEAITHYRLALELGHEGIAGLHEVIGDLQVLQGDYSSALGSYEMAAAHCGQQEEARVERKLGALHHRRGEWELAEGHCSILLPRQRPLSNKPGYIQIGV